MKRFYKWLKTANLALLGSFSALLLSQFQPADSFHVVAYYENWSQYRGPTKGVPPACIPSNFAPLAKSMTTLNYAFALFNYNTQARTSGGVGVGGGITGDWKVYLSEWNDVELIGQALALKNVNPDLKVLLSIGGWIFNEPSTTYGVVTYTNFSTVMADYTGGSWPFTPGGKMTALISSIVSLCVGDSPYGSTVTFDGVDLDWEYPGQIGRNLAANSTDYQGYLVFLSALRTALDSAATGLGRPLYLTLAAPALLPSTGVIAGNYVDSTNTPGSVNPNTSSTYFDWFKLASDYSDWLNVMTYDLNGPWNSVTGFNAPLIGGLNGYDISSAIGSWVAAGAEYSKLVVGIPGYARTFNNVAFPSGGPYGSGYSFNGPGSPGPITQQPGTLAYFEVITSFKQNVLKASAINSIATQAYAWNPNTGFWANYDTPDGADGTLGTAHLKMNWMMDYNSQQGLGGGMLYPLSQDQYWVTPNLLTSMFNALNGG